MDGDLARCAASAVSSQRLWAGQTPRYYIGVFVFLSVFSVSQVNIRCKMKITRRKTTLFIILMALAGLGILAWRTFTGDDQEPTYTTTQVEKGTIVSTISASGNLVQTNTFTVTTAATGVVKDVFVQDGDVVEKGQELIEITPDQDSEEARIKAWSSYLSAKNSLTSAEQNKLSLEKNIEDAKSKLITAQQDAEEAEDWDPTDPEKQKLNAERRSAEIALELAEQKYEQADEAITKARSDLNSAWIAYQQTSPTITAPQAGKASDISVAPGMVLSSSASGEQTGGSQKLLTIVGEPQPLLSASVNEIDIGKITVGQKVSLTFDALSDKTFTGKVVGVDRTGSATQGVVTYPVLIQLDTGEEQLYPNMSATAEIIIEAKENVLWVPPQAVRTQAGQTVVRVLVNGEPQEKQVEVGLETSDRAEIVGGLSEGETIVVSEQAAGEEATFGGGSFRGIMPGVGGPR